MKIIKLTENYSICFEIINSDKFSIFSSKRFLDLHKNKFANVFSFSLLDKKKICVGLISFGENNEKNLFSPVNGSYGGFEFDNNVTLEIKELFIKYVINLLDSKENRKIEITLAPEIYNLEQNTDNISILHRLNFKINKVEINQYINLFNYNFSSSVSYGNKKRINKCIKRGIEFKSIDPSNFFDAFNIIKINRERKKYPLTMNWDSLNMMIKTFPDKFHIFGLIDNGKMIASSICINVINDILYVFYWGEIGGYEKESPIAFLSQNLINYASKKNFRILDIGTSSDNSVPNIGLHKFKQNIGCSGCKKYYLKR